MKIKQGAYRRHKATTPFRMRQTLREQWETGENNNPGDDARKSRDWERNCTLEGDIERVANCLGMPTPLTAI